MRAVWLIQAPRASLLSPMAVKASGSRYAFALGTAVPSQLMASRSRS